MKTPPKILCVSANPAIDRRIYVESLRLGEVNRGLKAEPSAGGKAAHVAFVAQSLGANVRWLAFLGGVEGENCSAGVAARGVTPVVVQIATPTRINMELIDSVSGEITEILEPGPSITSDEKDRFLEEYRAQLHDQPVVVLSGSLPVGIESSFYADLIKTARDAGCWVHLDASGEPLSKGIEAAPHLIKPNLKEASALLGRPITSVEDAILAGRELHSRGAETVLISLGALGAVAVNEQSVLHGTAPQVKTVSTVGSGDSFLAGWTVAATQGMMASDCLRNAIACGTANCLAQSPGIFPISWVRQLLPQVEIRECDSQIR
jgi:1-phosphofructokinase family hexose kinase